MFTAIFVSIVLVLFQKAGADVTYDDLPGLYEVVGKGLPFCSKTLNLKTSGNTVTRMAFNGEEACSILAIVMQQKRVDVSSSDSLTFGTVDSASIGTVLVSKPFLCRALFTHRVTMGLFNPPKTVKSMLPGFDGPFEFSPGIKYIIISEEGKRSCIYHERGASSSPPDDDGVHPSDKDSNKTIGGREKVKRVDTGGGGGTDSGSDDSGIWVWLGPIIGAVATVFAALITVYCVRRGKSLAEKNDLSPARATGIAGGLHINVGQQGGHSQKLAAT